MEIEIRRKAEEREQEKHLSQVSNTTNLHEVRTKKRKEVDLLFFFVDG